MNFTEWIELEESVRKVQTQERFHHTIGVMDTACALAMNYEMDIERARIAGLFHDYGKNLVSNSEKPDLCDELGIKCSKFEKDNPHLLHGKIGAYYAEHKFGIKDEEILSAITYHTTGKTEMTPFEQIIFISDYIEPDRDFEFIPRRKEVRKMAFTDLDKCTEMIMTDTLNYLQKKGRPVDDTTRKAYEYYRDLVKEKESK